MKSLLTDRRGVAAPQSDGSDRAVGSLDVPTHDTEPVTVLVERRVAPGREEDFERWMAGLLRAAADFDGYLGGGVLRPNVSGGPWHAVYRFTSRTDLDRWEASPHRARLLEDADGLMAETAVRRLSGLEPWFELPGHSPARTAASPRRWKMALVAMLGVFPLALLINGLLLPHVTSWPLVARVLLFTSVLTPTMTWVVMPRLTWLLRDYLYPRGPGETAH